MILHKERYDLLLSVLDDLGLLSDILRDGLLDDSWSDRLVSLGGTSSSLTEDFSGSSWDVGVVRSRHIY